LTDARGCASGPVGRHAGRGAALTGAALHIMLRDTMATHKFAVGQAVRFSPDRDQEHAKGELFKIVHLLPETENVLQYRVKSDRRSGARRPRRSACASVKIDMPTIALELTRAPSDTSVEQTPQCAGPLLRGTGDTDSLQQVRLRNRVGDRTEATRRGGHNDLLSLRCRKRIPT
jgi:hypothetical protein